MPLAHSRAFVRLPLAGVAFLALADTAIVALALPPILLELNTDVAGVAAVLGVYAVVLAVALLPAERIGRALGVRPLGLAGVALFGVGSLVCGLADTLALLLIARGVQALGGAALLVTSHTVLVGAPRSSTGAEGDAGARGLASAGGAHAQGLHLWRMAALLGTAAGPAIGGALTQALGWRSIFLVQAPAALAAVPGCLAAADVRLRRPRRTGSSDSRRPLALRFAALGLISGAIAAALFLTVLLLISGWGYEPLVAALVVSVMPLSALAALRIPGHANERAAVGAVLVAAGAAALAFLPTASIAWTILPQVAVGIGMGLALGALAGELLPDRDGHESARLLTMRHAGIALALLILAPIAQHEIDTTLQDARLKGAALILDARIDPQLKLDLAPQLGNSIETEDPRGGLEKVFADGRGDVDEDQLAAYDDLTQRADDLLVTSVDEGFRTAFLVAAGLALLAAILLVVAAVPATEAAVPATEAAVPATSRVLGLVALGSVIGVVAFAAVASLARPEPVQIADPCKHRDLPSTGGLSGFAQDAALTAADVVACRVGSSREELVLALADDQDAHEYEQRYGVNPHSALNIAKQFLPG
jgi:MFS family permease